MVNVTGGSVEALLTLDASGFISGMEASISLVNSLSKTIGSKTGEIRGFSTALDGLLRSMKSITPAMERFETVSKGTESFNKFANAVRSLSVAIETLGGDTATASVGIARVMRIIESMANSFGTAEIKVTGLAEALRQLNQMERNTVNSTEKAEASLRAMQQDLLNLGNSSQQLRRIQDQAKLMNAEFQRSQKELMQFWKYGVEAFNQIDARSDALKSQIASMNVEFERSKAELIEFARYGRSQFGTITASTVQYAEALEVALPPTRQLITANVELANAERQVAGASTQESTSIEKDAMAKDKNTASTNRLSSATSRLSKVMSSLRMIGTMVASMMVWNFAHSLITATRETVNAKSEMEGYFQMLHFSQSEINQFNKALDQTVSKFQRINKYSLGETISSIGVEFNLTTQEMEKAMPVVSMITSEYLRAGRNANEASLAVKDILQGEFQRLSRETGVKGDQLKEAGWSGDKKDVMGLLEALDTVGKSRNWDVFVTKANSLNDAVLILQNRFGEWSADMVNVVQPTILAVFNNLLAFGQGASQSLSGMWKWLNSDGWGQTATKIGLVTTAVLTLMPTLVSLRSGASLLQATNMGVVKSLTALVFGINAETLATNTASSSLAMKVLSLNAEEVAESGVLKAITGRILGIEAEKVTTAQATLVNDGFIGSLYAVVTGETLAEASTLSLSGALTILTASFLASPIGWFTLAILGLASAFYVLTGGLSDAWEKMHQFNETMRDTGSAQKEAYKWLDQVKQKAGEDSEEFKKAKESVDSYTQSLQSASYWYNESQTAFNGLDLTRQTTSKDILTKYGISEEDANEWNANLDTLTFGKRKYYKAEQVLNKQLQGENSNFAKDLDEYLGKVQKNGGDLEDAYDRMAGNYDALAYHSYVANTTDSWWEWLWNSFYAGMDQFWIDWDKFWADPQWSGVIDGLYKVLDARFGITEMLKAIGIDLEDQSVGKIVTDFFNGIGKWFEGKSLMDILGLDESHDYSSDISNFVTNSIIKPMGTAIYNGLKTMPIIGAFITLFETLTDGDIGATLKGEEIGQWISNGLNTAINNIPILGQVKQLLEEVLKLAGDTDVSFSQTAQNISTNASSMASNFTNSFSGMESDHKKVMDNMVSHNKKSFDEMKNKNNTSLLSMRDSTSQTTQQMTSAWGTMKDSIVGSAKQISEGTTAHFNNLGSNIANFYRHLQNPAMWSASKVASNVGSSFSAGERTYSRTPKPATARRFVGKHGAGVNPYTNTGTKRMGIKDLVEMVGVNEKVDVNQFLSLFSGGFGGWNYVQPHTSYIKSVGHKWKSAPAVITGVGSAGKGYEVGRFVNGTPKFTFDEFLATAESVFSAIPYRFYYDSEWKGNWVNALLSGAMNCSDGADALLSLASLFGFSGSKVHTTLPSGTGHFYTVINGKVMDTTNFQNHRSWSALGGGAGSPPRSRAIGNNTEFNITINGDVYGMDDFETKMRDASRRVIREEFNDPYTVAI